MVAISELVSVLIIGLQNGMLLFLIAVGLTLIFGLLGILNFAHGSFYMLGAYLTFTLLSGFGGSGPLTSNFWIAAVVSSLAIGLLGIIIERTLIQPMYGRDHIFQLLLTFGLVLMIDNGARIIWGTSFRSVSVPSSLDFEMQLLGASVLMYNLFVIASGLVVAVAVWLFFAKSKTGKRIRAASEDRETADALGINVPLLYTVVFFVGSVLAGFGGAIATGYKSIYPAMGESIIINSFIVVVVGGMGSFAGAFIGSLLIGLTESIAFMMFPEIRAYIPYVLMAGILLVRPEGLFGGETHG